MVDRLTRRGCLAILAGGALAACGEPYEQTPDNSKPQPVALPRPNSNPTETSQQTATPQPSVLPGKTNINAKLDEYNQALNTNLSDSPKILSELVRLASQHYILSFVNNPEEQLAINKKLAQAPEVLDMSDYSKRISQDLRCLPLEMPNFVPMFEDLIVFNRDRLQLSSVGGRVTLPATLVFAYSLLRIQEIIPSIVQAAPNRENFVDLSGIQVPVEIFKGFAAFGRDKNQPGCSTKVDQKLDLAVSSDSTLRIIDSLGIASRELFVGPDREVINSYRQQVLDKYFPGEGYKIVLQLQRHSQRDQFLQALGNKIVGRKQLDPLEAGHSYIRQLFG